MQQCTFVVVPGVLEVRITTGLTQRTQVSTLEQSPERWRYGCDPGNLRDFTKDSRRLRARRMSLPTAIVFARAQCDVRGG
jgi:hypothetical protein